MATSNLSQKIRYTLALLTTSYAAYDIVTINTLTYSQQNKIKHKKLLTLLKLPYVEPQQGDLVLTMDNHKYEFKIVETSSGKYADGRLGMRVYVPPGFLMLRTIADGTKSMECCGAVVGQHNFDVTWITNLFNFHTNQ